MTGGGGDGNRVGANERLRREGRHHAQPRPREAHADHILKSGQHRVVADGAEMPAVLDGDHADADLTGLLHGQSHGPRSHHDPEPPLGVDHGGRGRLPQHAPAGSGIELAGPVIPDVRPQHVRHAVGFDPTEVRHGQDISSFRGVIRAHSELFEDLADGASQRCVGDEDLVFGGNFEALENHASLLGRNVSGQRRPRT